MSCETVPCDARTHTLFTESYQNNIIPVCCNCVTKSAYKSVPCCEWPIVSHQLLKSDPDENAKSKAKYILFIYKIQLHM